MFIRHVKGRNFLPEVKYHITFTPEMSEQWYKATEELKTAYPQYHADWPTNEIHYKLADWFCFRTESPQTYPGAVFTKYDYIILLKEDEQLSYLALAMSGVANFVWVDKDEIPA